MRLRGGNGFIAGYLSTPVVPESLGNADLGGRKIRKSMLIDHSPEAFPLFL